MGVFYICKNRFQFNKNLKKLRNNYNTILVEEYIPGKEIQAAVMGKKALGAIESLFPKENFYDYTANICKAKTKHVMPAEISKKI